MQQTRILCLCLGILLAPLASAQESIVVRDALQGLLNMSAQQCKQADTRMAQQKEKMELPMRLALEDGQGTLCRCVPEKVRGLLKTLPADVLDRRVTSQEELLAIVRPKALDPCTAEQLRRPYSYRCEDRFKSTSIDVHKYCGCMKSVVNAIPEHEATEMGFASAAYIPRAAEAKRKGEPEPARPAALNRLFTADANCKTASQLAKPKN